LVGSISTLRHSFKAIEMEKLNSTHYNTSTYWVWEGLKIEGENTISYNTTQP
jgi:hypothetical protein